MTKTKISTSLLCFLIPLFSFSQKTTESTESIGDLKGNALTVSIYQADERDIEKEWKSIMKSYGGSVKTKGNEIHVTDARIESISSGNVQVYAAIGEKNENKRTFTVIFKSEKGVVSSSDDVSGYTAANSILQAFTKKLSIEAATKYKDSQEKILLGIKKEKEDIENDNTKLLSNIEKWERQIEDAKYTMEKNKKALELNAKQMEAQEKVFDQSVKDLNTIK